MDVGIKVALFVFILLVVGGLGLIIFSGLSEIEAKEFCQSVNGEYESIYDCYFEEDGKYKAYKIKKIGGNWRLVK